MAAILDEAKLRRVLATMLNENEFLSPYGIRALSRYHAEHPYVYRLGDQEYGVGYLPGESDSGMFGGNSNWRGPIWMPVNAPIIRALLQYYLFYGNDFTIECPTGSGRQMNLYQVAEEITRRLASIFLRDNEGRRPVYEEPKSSRKTRTGAILFCSTSISTATTGRASAPATRPDGAGSSPGPCMCLPPLRLNKPWNSARQRLSRRWSQSRVARNKRW